MLTDFGIARVVDNAGPMNTAHFIGTPAYMAPEQVEGRADIDIRADIYALGTLLYELSTGVAAWHGESPLMIATACLRLPPPDPCARNGRVPRAVGNVILHCLALRREDRFASTSEAACSRSSASARSSTA